MCERIFAKPDSSVVWKSAWKGTLSRQYVSIRVEGYSPRFLTIHKEGLCLCSGDIEMANDDLQRSFQLQIYWIFANICTRHVNVRDRHYKNKVFIDEFQKYNCFVH